MHRYHVYIPIEYVLGYLRDGHFEGYIEAESYDKVLEKITNENFDPWENLDFYGNDFEIEQMGEPMVFDTEIEMVE